EIFRPQKSTTCPCEREASASHKWRILQHALPRGIESRGPAEKVLQGVSRGFVPSGNLQGTDAPRSRQISEHTPSRKFLLKLLEHFIRGGVVAAGFHRATGPTLAQAAHRAGVAKEFGQRRSGV